ncbi:hypothetical protein Bca101_021103 [Brassica carinata]
MLMLWKMMMMLLSQLLLLLLLIEYPVSFLFQAKIRLMMIPSDHENVLRTGPLSCSSILALLSNTLFLQPQREQRWRLDDNIRPGLNRRPPQ